MSRKKSVDELARMLSTVDSAEPIGTLKKDLAALQASYRDLNIEDQIKNNNSALVLTDKNLVEITKIVEKMRTSIVE